MELDREAGVTMGSDGVVMFLGAMFGLAIVVLETGSAGTLIAMGVISVLFLLAAD